MRRVYSPPRNHRANQYPESSDVCPRPPDSARPNGSVFDSINEGMRLRGPTEPLHSRGVRPNQSVKQRSCIFHFILKSNHIFQRDIMVYIYIYIYKIL